MASLRTIGLTTALLALTVLTYLPVRQAGFIWDDDDHLTANPVVTAPDGLTKIWSSLRFSRYYPLTLTTFWIEQKLWDFQPAPYHMINVLLHGANAILIYLVLRRLQVRPAWVIAAMWAIHPVNAESVAWMTELKNVQSGFFFFLAILSYLEFGRDRRWRWYFCSVICGAAAVLSKSSTVVLPAVLLLCVWWKNQRLTLRDGFHVAPFFLLSLLMGLLTITEQQRMVTAQPGWSLAPVDRIYIAGRAIYFYAGKLLWPPGLCFIYPRWNLDAKSFLAWAAWPGLFVILGWLWCYRGKTWARAGLFGLGYFVVALLPVLGFFNIFFFRYSFVADHFQYLACPGIIALVGAGVNELIRPPQWKRVVAGAVIISLGLLCCQHTLVFADPESLWQDTIARNPQSVLAQNNLGLLLYSQLQYRQAIEYLRRAIQFDPGWPEPHYNLGLVLTEIGRYPEAREQIQTALGLQASLFKAENELGVILSHIGQPEAATGHFHRALELNPDYLDAHTNLGKLLLRAGQIADAEAEFRRAIEIEPRGFAGHENLGVVLLQQGRLAEAVAEFHKAAESKTDDPEPHKYLAEILTKERLLPEAQKEHDLATSLADQLSETHYRIANALKLDKDPDGAAKHYRKSIAFQPENVNAYLALGELLAEQHRTAEAIATLREGLTVVPNDPRLRDELRRLPPRRSLD